MPIFSKKFSKYFEIGWLFEGILGIKEKN